MILLAAVVRQLWDRRKRLQDFCKGGLSCRAAAPAASRCRIMPKRRIGTSETIHKRARLREVSKVYLERGFVAETGDVEKLTKLLGHAPRRYQDFAAETAALWK